MTEIIINGESGKEIGFELSIEEADFLISTGYQYKEKNYRDSKTYVPVAMPGMYGDIVIHSIPKTRIERNN